MERSAKTDGFDPICEHIYILVANQPKRLRGGDGKLGTGKLMMKTSEICVALGSLLIHGAGRETSV